MSEGLRAELLAKYPGRAKRALGNSKTARIELHCIECMGGSNIDAVNCECTDCFCGQR